MSINPAQAAQAYGAIARLGGKTDQTRTAGNFGDLVNNAIQNTTDTGRVAEAKALDLATGRSDIVDLVTAVAETEVAVETMVAVRDRVITAYQEILNMPI